MSKNNVHPDHYKVGGRDRQDDAAAARFAQSVAAKGSSRERPARMTKGPYFQRPESAAPAPAGPAAKSAQKNSSPRAGTAKKAVARKASPPRKTATRKAAGRTGRTAKPAARKK
jgi:hypothetical protein